MEKQSLQQLVDRGLSQKKIAIKCDVCKTTVRRWLIKFGLKTDITKNKRNKRCLNCNIRMNSIRQDKKFCNNYCQGELQLKISYEKLKRGEMSWPTTIRKVLLRFRKHKCELCGRKTWKKKPIPLVIDHIDGDPTNNYLKNLRIICCNCDAQLSTYKGKNKGNGRYLRRKRYREGSSY